MGGQRRRSWILWALILCLLTGCSALLERE